MVELAVIPTGAIRFLQPQHRDAMMGGELLDLLPEPVADLAERTPATGSGCPSAR